MSIEVVVVVAGRGSMVHHRMGSGDRPGKNLEIVQQKHMFLLNSL